jgi:DNA-binding NarL/FixJ family response regulator
VVIALLTDPTPQAYCNVLAAGAFPVAWDVPPAVIVSVLEAAIRGEVVLPQDVASRLAWTETGSVAPAGESVDLLPLGEAEVQILGRIARGDTDRKIASALQISERTVRRRLQLIFSKLGV